MKNTFGGNWTEAKMEIIVDYAKAYLTIMSKQSWAKTIYFDGFAGSGLIAVDGREDAVKGTSLRILDIIEPKPFDVYYFVEKDQKIKEALELNINANYFGKNAHVVCEDCNTKLFSMANFLSKNKTYRALAFIDPYGMSVNWDSINNLKGLGIDLWILVPTGLGINRLLKNNGDISEAWLLKLEKFLGLSREEIRNHFYKTQVVNTLFGEETLINKEKSTVLKAGELYQQRLSTVFEFVSKPFIMKNKTNSIMYHFMMATNNKAALQVANDVIKPKYNS
ncbi:MAG: three-Cys-motif partner protein TcmP [Sphingobacteriaceae bacterium]